MSQSNEPIRTRRRNLPDTGAGIPGDTPRYSSSAYERRSMAIPDTDDFADEDMSYQRPRPSSITRQDTFQNNAMRRPPTTPRTTGAAQGRPQSARNYTTTGPQQRPLRDTQQQGRPQYKKPHWLLFVGLGMVAVIVLWVLGSSVLAWGNQLYNNVRYGYPRTYQTNAVVGHSDSKAHPSHFIAINLNHQVVIEEFMGGDPSKAITYVAPVYIAGDNGDLAPVTLEFRDVNGDGKVDMIVHIHLPSQDQISVFINTGTKFRAATPNDKIQLNP